MSSSDSNSCRKSFTYIRHFFMRQLFEGGNYSRKYRICLNNYQVISHHKFLDEMTGKSFRCLWIVEFSLSLGFHKIFTDLKRSGFKSLGPIDYHYFLVGNWVFWYYRVIEFKDGEFVEKSGEPSLELKCHLLVESNLLVFCHLVA